MAKVAVGIVLLLALAVAPAWASGSIEVNGVSCPATTEDLGSINVSWTTSGEPEIVHVGVRPYPNQIILWHSYYMGNEDFDYVQLGVEYDFFLGSGGSTYTSYDVTHNVDATWAICYE